MHHIWADGSIYMHGPSLTYVVAPHIMRKCATRIHDLRTFCTIPFNARGPCVYVHNGSTMAPGKLSTIHFSTQAAKVESLIVALLRCQVTVILSNIH